MKLLFNMEIVDGNRIQAHPGDYLRSLLSDEQVGAVRGFPDQADTGVRDNPDPQACAEAGIGIVSAHQFLDGLQETPRICTGGSERDD